MADTYWVLEMEGIESGDIDAREVFDDPAKLAKFVEVNGRDARLFRIAIADASNLVELRIGEVFSV